MAVLLLVCRHRLVGDDSVFCHACNKASCTTRPIWDASILVSSGRVAGMIVVYVGAGHRHAELPQGGVQPVRYQGIS